MCINRHIMYVHVVYCTNMIKVLITKHNLTLIEENMFQLLNMKRTVDTHYAIKKKFWTTNRNEFLLFL